jgi:hypothetical protein
MTDLVLAPFLLEEIGLGDEEKPFFRLARRSAAGQSEPTAGGSL